MNSLYIVEILQLKSLFSDFGILRGYYVLWVEKILEERREGKEGRNLRKKLSFRSEKGVKKSVS